MEKFYYSMTEVQAITGAKRWTILGLVKRLRLKISKNPHYRFTPKQIDQIASALPLYRKVQKTPRRTRPKDYKLTPARLRELKNQAWRRVAAQFDHALGNFTSTAPYIAVCQWCGLSLTFDARTGELSGAAAEEKCKIIQSRQKNT